MRVRSRGLGTKFIFTCMVFYAVTLSFSQRWLLACDPVTLHYLRTVILRVARSCCRACLLLLSHVASCQQVKSRDTAKTVIRADVQGGPKMGPQTHDHNSVIFLTDLRYFFTGRFLPW